MPPAGAIASLGVGTLADKLLEDGGKLKDTNVASKGGVLIVFLWETCRNIEIMVEDGGGVNRGWELSTLRKVFQGAEIPLLSTTPLTQLSLLSIIFLFFLTLTIFDFQTFQVTFTAKTASQVYPDASVPKSQWGIAFFGPAICMILNATLGPSLGAAGALCLWVQTDDMVQSCPKFS